MKKAEALSILHLEGIPNPSKQEIDAAWRNLTRLNHPDQHRSKPVEVQEAAEESMKRINIAHDVLLDGSWEPDAPKPEPVNHEPTVSHAASKASYTGYRVKYRTSYVVASASNDALREEYLEKRVAPVLIRTGATFLIVLLIALALIFFVVPEYKEGGSALFMFTLLSMVSLLFVPFYIAGAMLVPADGGESAGLGPSLFALVLLLVGVYALADFLRKAVGEALGEMASFPIDYYFILMFLLFLAVVGLYLFLVLRKLPKTPGS